MPGSTLTTIGLSSPGAERRYDGAAAERIAALESEIERLNRVNTALMDRVERNMELQGNAFALFQTATLLEQQVRERTRALETALHDYAGANRDLQAAKRELETAQNRLNDALEAISDGFILCDVNDRIVAFNVRFRELWRGMGDLLRPGQSFARLISRAIDSGLVRNDKEARRWLARRARNRYRHTAHVLELSNGLWLRISERQTREGGSVGIYSDVTSIKALERRRRERELAAKSTLLQATLDNLSQGVSVFDRNLELVAWNHRLAELLDVPEDQLHPGAALEEFLHLPAVRRQFTDDAMEPRELERHLKAARSFAARSLEITCPSGRALEVRSNPMPNGGFVTTYTDITDHKRSEEALRDSERRIRLVTDAMPALIAYIDTEERYRFTNKAYEAWYGRPQSEIDGHRMCDVLSPEQYRLRRTYVKRVLAGESVEFDFEFALSDNGGDGARTDAHAVYVPHRASDGTVLGFFTLIQDITERKRSASQLAEANRTLERRVAERTHALTTLNTQLRQEVAERAAAEAALRLAKAEAEQANLSKTKFLAAASHDLLQPLNAARVFTAALSERRLGPRNMELVDNLTQSLEAVDEMLTTLLDLSKLDAGVLPTCVTHFEVDTLLRHMATEFQPLALERGLALRVHTCGLTVRSDAALLGRILRNFLTNALRYTPSGRIVLGCRRGPGGLRIGVWDTGVGIPSDKLAEVFQEFRRLKGSADKLSRGAGLGLAIVDRIARRLGHPVLVRSTCGRGSMFAVEVPYGDPALVARGAPACPAAAAGTVAGATLLVIDNEPATLTSMASLLQEWGCNVLTVETEDEARAAIGPRHDAIDLIVADFHLHDGRTGLDAIRTIREHCGRYVPAVVITADRTAEMQASVKEHGHHLLTKPVKPARLRATVAHLLSRRGV
ncbi:NahK/ErcS family hybrid sensor histidine kinase/response regulator [Azospirillum halopraeferens]|uniref:NahK/ErcS family hybrid sensor histidine kinase/response regulator n=1 Tax=Azospirillum halopraeferens TaxID=34010 RepID=UPI0004294AAA|nr:NahK/ErcS family hybrid sensor histidine kinase/response regulator [Azospirillum halopraeferens]